MKHPTYDTLIFKFLLVLGGKFREANTKYLTDTVRTDLVHSSRTKDRQPSPNLFNEWPSKSYPTINSHMLRRVKNHAIFENFLDSNRIMLHKLELPLDGDKEIEKIPNIVALFFHNNLVLQY